MIRKHALIFGYQGESGDENFCTGVPLDLENYKNYLMSPHGGCWEEDEINCCLNVKKESLLQAIEYINTDIDYSVVIFSGHGQFNSLYGETELELNSQETILVSELYTGCMRELYIFDCCRVPSQIPIQESVIKSFSFSEENFSNYEKIYYKNLFDDLLQKSVSGRVEIYACSKGETSTDLSHRGGLFSVNFLNQATGDEDLSVYKTFYNAKLYLEQNKAKQHPEICKPRSGKTFPFYIA